MIDSETEVLTNNFEVKMGDPYPPHIETTIALSMIAQRHKERILIAGGSAFDLYYFSDLHLAPPENRKGLRDVDAIFDSTANPDALVDETQKEMVLSGLTPVEMETSSDLGRRIKLIGPSAFLTYKDLQVEVDQRVFQPIIFNVDGHQIPVVRPQTLYHLFRLFTGAYDREKDVLRANILKTQIIPKYPTDFDSSYDAFDLFHDLREKYYALDMRRFRAWQVRTDKGIRDDTNRVLPGMIRRPLAKVAYGISDNLAKRLIPKPYKGGDAKL